MSKRLRFLTYHLTLSVLITLFVIVAVYGVWYPFPLAQAVGVTHILLMLIAIDVVLGPALGFLVYKEGKKTLKFDLTVIILLQASALGYGVYSIEQGRPAWLAFHAERFELIRKNEIILDHIDQANVQYQKVSWTGPQFVAVKPAKNIQQHNDDVFIEVLGRVSLAQQPERYEPLSNVRHRIKHVAQNLALLSQFNDKASVTEILTKYPQANAYLPLKANAVDMTVLINRDTAEIIKIVDLRPWK